MKRKGPPRQAAPGKAHKGNDSGSNYNNIPAELKALHCHSGSWPLSS
jgi:hypothetical protein